MFILKSLSDKVFKSNNIAVDKVRLSGELYQQIEQSSVRNVTSECLYLDSVITIQKTTRPNYFNLIVSRVFEEGEDELENDNSEDELSDDYYEKIFLITEDLSFIKKIWDHDDKKKTAFFWLDKSDDEKVTRYIFVPEKETETFVNNFENAVYQCIYQSKFENDAVNTDEEAFNKYIDEYKAKSLVYNTENEVLRNSTTGNVQRPVEAIVQDSSNSELSENVNNNRKNSTNLTVPKSVASIQKELKTNVNGEVYSCYHNIFKYDILEAEFRVISENNLVKIKKSGRYDYTLELEGDINMNVPIDSNLNEDFNNEFKSFIWCIPSDNGLDAYSIVFNTLEEKDEFQRIFNLCKYESVQRKSIQKAKDNDELEYLLRAFDNNLVISDGEEEHDFSKQKQNNNNTGGNEPNSYFVLGDESEEEKEEEEEEEKEEENNNNNKIIRNETQSDEEDEEDKLHTDDGLTNEELAMAYKYDRSFVVRGNKIGVFKHTDNEKLKYVTTIDNIQGLDNTKFVPENLMLHEQDNALLMLNKDAYDSEENKVYKMDLNRGEVVEEYNTDYEYIKGLCPTSKYAQLTSEKTFLGYRDNSLFLMDPRLQKKNFMDVKFQYTSNPKFTCMATTGNGNIVLGNAKGKISLYNRIGVKATTVLPGIGDEIIAIDVTNDGRYLVATTKTYLLFVDVKDMFEYSATKKIKPVPRKLQLRPQDIVNMKGEVSFTPARFDIGEGLERSIITSTGPYMITWNLRRLKLNHDDSYRIRRCNDTIVSENFRYNENKNIVFTSPNNVAMVTEGTFRAPNSLFSKKK
ncbi:VID27-domain-containing protein [Anaeromyces robustus]|jgi:hypothetical protein|uniref:VID27-domain-containing protein n=1 Tax=Anaeromyces robustus TaxID=1754192 RepID=A0A1Y1XM07_9FUNG|nr:VID27-domain-containing protein [Anaeromyces robustus]|eukprot:ORX86733.1 VID27-domain-containing protein [Anaeromyces robustus]